MTREQALQQARQILIHSNFEEAVLESELLLRYTLGISRVQLYQNPGGELSSEEEAALGHLIERRLSGEPAAYITGQREFYGFDFYVNSSVLIPRPESELLVEKAIHLARCHTIHTLADIGTGCGAIAVSLALNLPYARIYATDISADALYVARYNCRKHRVADSIILLAGDMLDPLPEAVDLIVANLPYVRESELATIYPAKYEPWLALNGGPDGLDRIRRLCYQTKNKLNPGGGLLLEIGQGQAKALTNWLRGLFPAADIEILPDLAGIERVVSLTSSQLHPINQEATPSYLDIGAT